MVAGIRVVALTHGVGPPGAPRDRRDSSFVYFSFVTLTTVGYGDMTPVHPATRSLAIAEALIGQLYPAILLARLVSLASTGEVEHPARRNARQRGPERPKRAAETKVPRL